MPLTYASVQDANRAAAALHKLGGHMERLANNARAEAAHHGELADIASHLEQAAGLLDGAGDALNEVDQKALGEHFVAIGVALQNPS